MEETFEQTSAVVPVEDEPTEAQPQTDAALQAGSSDDVNGSIPGAEAEPVVPSAGSEDGAVPEPAPQPVTESLIRKMRAKYFTVRHQRLEGCGHKYDQINEPQHRNCENCWFQWFNTHPQLVEVTDQFYRIHGAKALEGMRGTKYLKMFRRYMATVVHFMQEEGRLNESSSEGRVSDVFGSSKESGTDGTTNTPVEGGETESGGLTEQVAEHILQVCAPSEAGQEETSSPTIYLD